MTLVAHVFDAHSPYKPPADLASTYADAPYFGEVAFIDRSLAPRVLVAPQLLPTLREGLTPAPSDTVAP